jgi:hypothetical protein
VTYGIKDLVSAETDFKQVTNSLKGNGSVGGDKDTIYYYATEFLEKALKDLRTNDKGYRIVIFIDDLDRCTPERALEVLESIKSFFDIEGIVYVVGMDSETINSLVKKKYGEDSAVKGLDYMQKIVQLPFQIPTWHKEDISDFLDHIINKDLADSAFKNELLINKKILMKAVKTNPREAKRFVNDLILSRAAFDKPTDRLIVVQALKFRREWNNFLEFLTGLSKESRRDFLEQCINLPDTISEQSKWSSTIPDQYKNDLLKAYPSFFEENDSLRKFLDGEVVRTLLKIQNISEYTRALDVASLRKYEDDHYGGW